jgi:hypothetical protein
MNADTAQMQTLRRALKHCGGEAPLAKALGISLDDLSSLLTGGSAPGAQVYLNALSLVAPGGRGGGSRRGR